MPEDTATSSELVRLAFPVPAPGSPLRAKHALELAGLPQIEGDFGRVVAILGANGTGKSRLLRNLAQRGAGQYASTNIVYVEGGRAIVPSLRAFERPQKYTRPVGGGPDPYERYCNASNSQLSDRLLNAFHVLAEEHEEISRSYLEAIAKWLEQGQQGDAPARPTSRLDRLQLFFETTFSGTKLNVKKSPWTCSNQSADGYPVASLSDGEKQVLGLAADIGVLAADPRLIVVDEPELNLHPSLAAKLWDWLEQQRPQARFVYATHSLPFAMRSSVTDIIVLGEPREPVRHITPTGLHREDLTPFLGAIPAILKTSRALVTEGEPGDSFDTPFYRWVLGDPAVAVEALGNCDRVRAAVNHSGLWELASGIDIIGVIDRDYMTDEEAAAISQVSQGRVVVLPYHEAESFLCHPDLLVAASRYGDKPSAPKRAELVERLAERCQKWLTNVAMKRAQRRTTIRLSVSATDRTSANLDRAAAEGALRRWAADECKKVERLSPNNVAAYFKEELEACEKAIRDRNVEAMLKLFPGKEVAPWMAQAVGFRNERSVLTVMVKNAEAAANEPLARLKDLLVSHLNDNGPTVNNE